MTRTALLCDLRQQCTLSLYETEEDCETRKHKKAVKRTESITTAALLDHMEIDTLIVAAPALPYLSVLSSLLLQNNRLKQLPAEVWRLVGLQELDVSHNQLEELSPDIGLLTNLRALYIHNNKFTEVPGQIGQLQKLAILDVSCNRLTCLPSQLKHVRMEQLWTSGNPFTNDPISFDNVLTLQSISAQTAGSLPFHPTDHQWLPTTLSDTMSIKDPATAPRCSLCTTILFHPGLLKVRHETVCHNQVPLLYRACNQSCHARI